MKFVIVGSGAAAMAALKEILKLEPAGKEITMITRDKYPFYYRPRLIECLSGRVKIDDITIHDKQWFKKKGIELVLAEKVIALEPEKKYVRTEKQKFSYDKLLLAQGAKPFVPPIKGKDKENIFTLREAEDAKAIQVTAQKVKQAVVIGCGLLGLESAYNLLHNDVEVTLLEVAAHILPRQLDEAGARILQQILEEKGLKFRTGVIAEEFIGEETVSVVKLNNGDLINTELVLLNTGIRANLALVAGLEELEIDKGIVVNKYMETGLADVFAAGDVVNFQDHLYGLWSPAQLQGEVAGSNLIGKRKEFIPQTPETRLKVVGVDVIAIGEREGGNYKIDLEPANNRYRKIFYQGKAKEKKVGAIIVGAFDDNKQVIKEIKSQALAGETNLMKKYQCSVCGYIYDPEKGDHAGGIEPGTVFADLPATWVCPVCGVGQDRFTEVQ